MWMMASRCVRKKLFLFTLLCLTLTLQPRISLAFGDLGVPVKEAMGWGAYVGPGKTGARDTIYISFAQYQAPLFLLAVNPDAGELRQFNGPLSSEMGSWGFTIDRGNRIYLGSYYGAHLLRFDPKTEEWDDLGQPGGEKESFICSIATAPDGKIWGGTFPSANLFYYDPETGKSENFDRMDPEQFYCYPTVGEDGLVYCAIQFQKMDIVVFDPKRKFTITQKKLHMNVDYTPWEGWDITGMPQVVYSRGRKVAEWSGDQVKFVGEIGKGRFVKRVPLAAF